MNLSSLHPESFLDIIRLVNVALSLAVGLGLLFSPASPWRIRQSTQHFTATVLAMFILWFGWRMLRAALRDVPTDGSGIVIYTVILLAILADVIIQSLRIKRRVTAP